MKRLPPAKRNQLIIVTIATAGLIGLVYFMLIGPQKQQNAQLGENIKSEQAHLQQIKTVIKQMEATTNSLANLTQQLSQTEADIASGDLYAWTYDTIRQFKSPYHVDIPSVGQPTPGDCDLIANFPYQQIKFSLNGTGYYHDLGKFIADFENKFPHCRVLNLQTEPTTDTATGGEKLNFRMDVIALVKPNT
jgi:Tfp pilus assembly protein PilO